MASEAMLLTAYAQSLMLGFRLDYKWQAVSQHAVQGGAGAETAILEPVMPRATTKRPHPDQRCIHVLLLSAKGSSMEALKYRSHTEAGATWHLYKNCISIKFMESTGER